MNIAPIAILGAAAVILAIMLLKPSSAQAATIDTSSIMDQQPTISEDQAVIPSGKDRLSASDIAQVASNAGFTGDDLAIAVAISLAESGGDPAIENPELKYFAKKGIDAIPANSSSIGLWQIFRYVHPEFMGWDLTDPQANANAAFSVYSDAGYSFKPWATFDPRDGSTPKYLAHLSMAQGAVNA